MKSRNRVLYYGKKAAAFLASVLLLSVLVFYISRLAPGDPLVSYYGDRVEKMTPEERAWAEEKLGLNDPISVQYIRWAGNALHGDFGISYKYKMDVTRVIEGRIGNTLVLGGIGFLLIFTLALLLGILCAWKEDTWLDRIICKVGTITGCIPEFWLSLLLILVFSMQLKWLPSSGAYSVGKQADFSDRVCHLILPMSQGAETKDGSVPALPAEYDSVVSWHHGHFCSACAGGNLYCRNGFLVSRYRNAGV